ALPRGTEIGALAWSAKGARRTRRAWVEGRIKRVAAAGRRGSLHAAGRCATGRRECARSRRKCSGGARRRRHRRWPRTAVLLQAPQLVLELLVAILQLLDLAGELADLILQLIKPDDEIGGRHLGGSGSGEDAAERGKRKGAEHVLHEGLPDCG